MGPLLTPSLIIRRCAKAQREFFQRNGTPFEVPAKRKAETDRVLSGVSDGFRPLEPKRVTSGGVDVSTLRTRYFLHITRAAEAQPVLLMDNRLTRLSGRWQGDSVAWG